MQYIIETSNDTHALGRELALSLGSRYEKQPALTYLENGKPVFMSSKLGISISHSKNYVLAAINNGPVGADIEVLRLFDARIAARFFDTAEADFAKLSSENFFRVWTVKEAYLKLTGEGLRGLRHVKTVKNGRLCEYINGYRVASFIYQDCAVAIVYAE